jgi:hypothetical protein
MSMQPTKVLVPPPIAMPRGAKWASELATRLAQMGHTVWVALEKVGQARAQSELERLAACYPHNSELGQALRDAINRNNRG